MALVFAISMYVVIWWIVLFAMLPIGVRTPGRGRRGGPRHARKARRISRDCCRRWWRPRSSSSIVFAALYVIIVHHVITLDEIPFLPRYETCSS